MKTKVAINGFGRIGRMVCRILMQHKDKFELTGINDLTDTKTLAHLLKYDSVHGKYNGTVDSTETAIIIDGIEVQVSSEKEIENIPWKNNVDIVLESTGVFTNKLALERHLSNGAQKVILSAPAKDELDATIVLGVNDEILTGDERILSNASCTTNCLAPVAKVLNDRFGIESGLMCTIHAYTNDQRILDLPHRDLRRARTAAVNTIPTSTGAAKAVGVVIPELKGKLNGYAVRVPVPDGSLTDFNCILKSEATREQINEAVKEASETYLRGILEYTEEPIVSTDIIGNTHSSIFDSQLTDVQGKLVKVVCWYDNEYGYSNRLVDLMIKLSKQM